MVNILRSLFLLALLVALSSSASFAQTTEPSILQGSSKYFPSVDVKAVRKVRCTGGHGTGFVIARGQIMTAYHVINGQAKCVDDETDRELKPIYWNPELDIAVLGFKSGKHEPRPMRVTCAAYTTTGTYYSYGFAGMGFYDLMITRLRAVDDYIDDSVRGVAFSHMRALRGVIIPGMSGGPILNDHGYVVGMNNLTGGEFHFGMSREMNDTYLCKRKR